MSQSTQSNRGCLSLFPFWRPQRKNIGDPAEEARRKIIEEIEREEEEYPYRQREDFLSAGEYSFYMVLNSILGDLLVACPKVALKEIFFVSRPEDFYSAFNRINRKHVDFVICIAKTMKPVFAIELDDRSHNRPDRMERDEFVDKVFRVAGLPLVHVPARNSYDTNELKRLFNQALRNTSAYNEIRAVAKPPEPITPGQTPMCPKCGIPMVLRTARTGRNSGNRFYGCPNWPKCTEIINLKPEDKPSGQVV
jgi:predicted RNA-binding Zn-ribbon protein involved in translation (DUF1610 family)